MIYITGDKHRKIIEFFSTVKDSLKQEDYIIICGDFGLIWNEEEKVQKETGYLCRYLEEIPGTILVVPGNHEGYDLIEKFPVEEWNGGKVRHIVKDKIIYLERGQVFEIEGKKFFAFGGASSHDIQAGILEHDDKNFQEKRKRLELERIPYRINHWNWWKQELPSQEEMEEGRKNLEKVNYQVDYVISHCASDMIQKFICNLYVSKYGRALIYEHNVLTKYFQELESKLDYKHWFFGHYHLNEQIDEKHTVLYEKIQAVPPLTCRDAG